MTIRKANSNDLGTINSFDVFSGDRGAEIERGEIWLGVDEELNVVTSYLTFNHSFFNKAFIQYIVVAEPYRKKGIANELMAHIEDVVKQEKIFISTETTNLTMLKLFERRGYKIVGVIEEIQDCGEIVFCKKGEI